jgi:hypothetical protein
VCVRVTPTNCQRRGDEVCAGDAVMILQTSSISHIPYVLAASCLCVLLEELIQHKELTLVHLYAISPVVAVYPKLNFVQYKLCNSLQKMCTEHTLFAPCEERLLINILLVIFQLMHVS